MLPDFVFFVLDLGFKGVFILLLLVDLSLFFSDGLSQLLLLLLELFAFPCSMIFLQNKIIKFLLNFGLTILIFSHLLINLIDIFFQTSQIALDRGLVRINFPQLPIILRQLFFYFCESIIQLIFL